MTVMPDKHGHVTSITVPAVMAVVIGTISLVAAMPPVVALSYAAPLAVGGVITQIRYSVPGDALITVVVDILKAELPPPGPGVIPAMID